MVDLSREAARVAVERGCADGGDVCGGGEGVRVLEEWEKTFLIWGALLG